MIKLLQKAEDISNSS